MAQNIPPTTQSLTHRVAREVRAEMARQQISQSQVGEILGFHQSQVSKRLRGDLSFTTAELDKLAEALGVPVERFLVSLAAGAA